MNNNNRLSSSGLKPIIVTEEKKNKKISLLPKYEEIVNNRVYYGTITNIKSKFLLYIKDSSNIIVKHSSYQSVYRATRVSKHYIKK